MAVSSLEQRYQEIESAMAQLQRTSWRAIYPADVYLILCLNIPEKHIRQDMDQLVGLGRLVKVGRGVSRGYRLATVAQRQAHLAKYAMRPRGDIHVSDYTELTYSEIEKVVAKAYRDLKRGVLPRDVQPRFPVYRAEGSLRRDMLSMVAAGRLVRVSGVGARQGYRIPTRIEKLAFTINQGMWPYGTEMVGSWAN